MRIPEQTVRNHLALGKKTGSGFYDYPRETAKSQNMDKAVILAGGLGTRMMQGDGETRLSDSQAALADTGMKGLILTGRPFLDYVLNALADAGYRRICFVIGPDHDAIRAYYEKTVTCRRLVISFAIQARPLGTADAVAAAESFAADDPFLAINSDNYYPPEVLCALRELGENGLIAFERDGLLAGGNIPSERIARFALVQADNDGYLTRIIEKPSPEFIEKQPEPICVSMNCWRFDPGIFPACRAISKSPRGELEITDAVQYAGDTLGMRFRALSTSAPVLDLTSRSDVAKVADRLSGLEVDL